MKRKPFFDKDGNWWLPNEEIFADDDKKLPKLKIKERFCWLLDNTSHPPAIAYRNLVGVPTTVWRIRKKLKEKGYLTSHNSK